MTKDEAWKRLRTKYPFAIDVPKAGASCATCRYVRDNGTACANRIYRTIHGTKKLGADADQWCCSAWSQDK